MNESVVEVGLDVANTKDVLFIGLAWNGLRRSVVDNLLFLGLIGGGGLLCFGLNIYISSLATANSIIIK